MQAEVDFLRYANEVAPGRVPEIIYVDDDQRCIILEHIVGSSYTQGARPPKEDVSEAIDFFRRLNVDLELAKHMISLDAAEGFLSLSQHMTNVRERLLAMGSEHLPGDFRYQAEELLARLKKLLDRTERVLEMQIQTGYVEDQLSPLLRCISPGDFGFHNAIRTPECVRFIDFEFSGWDDPAKASIDFVLQPRVPVDLGDTLLHSVNCNWSDSRICYRHRALKPILRLKWILIILSILRESRLNEIASRTADGCTVAIIRSRLEQAYEYMTAF